MPHPWERERLDLLQRRTRLAHIEFYESVESTNTVALEMLKSTDVPIPTLIIAHEQTAGRGRGSNQWWSPTGSLMFSLIASLATPGSRGLEAQSESWLANPTALTTLRVGLAIAKALLAMESLRDRVQVKWPNDIYVDERKLAGILVESVAGKKELVIGCGFNVNQQMENAPEEIRDRATSLFFATGETLDLPDFAESIIREVLRMLQETNEPKNWATDYRKLCFLNQKLIRVTTGNQSVTGRCMSIDDQGCLILVNEQGSHAIMSGTVDLL